MKVALAYLLQGDAEKTVDLLIIALNHSYSTKMSMKPYPSCATSPILQILLTRLKPGTCRRVGHIQT
jgi:hypothetical protein